MKKTILIIVFLILAIIIGFFVGIYMYNTEESEKQMENDIENIERNSNLPNTNIEGKIEVETSIAEEKISVKTEVIEEVYYTKCDHLITNKRKDIKSLINMTVEKIKSKYPDWEVKEFSIEKVVLYKEEQAYCGEHFLLKDVDGFVTIYNMDNEDRIKERIEITDIETAYLPEVDQENLKEGIKVFSQQELNKVIEDFE